jgi:hypothetical protein
MSIRTSAVLFNALSKVMTVPKNCVSFDLSFSSNGFVQATAVYYPEIDVDGFASVMSCYELKEIDALSDAPKRDECVNFDVWLASRRHGEHQRFMNRTSVPFASDRA